MYYKFVPNNYNAINLILKLINWIIYEIITEYATFMQYKKNSLRKSNRSAHS